MPSYIELDKLGSLPPASNEGKVILGINQSGNLSIVDNNGQTTSAGTTNSNKLTLDFNSVGPKVSFVKTNYGSEVDVIIPGVLEITRGNDSGIYNIALETQWSNNTPANTEWNSKYTDATNYGWLNLLTAGDRTFDTLRDSLNNQIGKYAIRTLLIMRETTTGRMWLIKFNEWTPNAQGGGFAYDRYELMPTIEFVRPDGEQNTVDEITPGRTILKRDSYPNGDCVGGGLYNAALENFYNNCVVYDGPVGTEWNSSYINDTTYGFDDVSDVRYRKYGTWYEALGSGNVGNRIIGLEMIMHDLATDSYYKIQFSSWTQNGNGGGFAYTRTLIPLQQVVTFPDGTMQETALGGVEKKTGTIGSLGWGDINDMVKLDTNKEYHMIDTTGWDAGSDDLHFYLPTASFEGQRVELIVKQGGTNLENNAGRIKIWMDSLRDPAQAGNISTQVPWYPFVHPNNTWQSWRYDNPKAIWIDGAWTIDNFSWD